MSPTLSRSRPLLSAVLGGVPQLPLPASFFDQLPFGERLRSPSQETSSNGPCGPTGHQTAHASAHGLSLSRHVCSSLQRAISGLAPSTQPRSSATLLHPLAGMKTTAPCEDQGHAMSAPSASTTLRHTARQRSAATCSRVAPAAVSLLPMQDSDGAILTGCPATSLHSRTLVVCGVPPSHPHRCGIRLLAPFVPGLPFPGGHRDRLLRHTNPLHVAVQEVSLEPAQARRRPHRPLQSLTVLPATWTSAVPRERSLGVELARTTRRAAPPMSSYPYRSTMTRLLRTVGANRRCLNLRDACLAVSLQYLRTGAATVTHGVRLDEHRHIAVPISPCPGRLHPTSPSAADDHPPCRVRPHARGCRQPRSLRLLHPLPGFV